MLEVVDGRLPRVLMATELFPSFRPVSAHQYGPLDSKEDSEKQGIICW